MGELNPHFTVGQFRGFTMVDSVVQLPAAAFFANVPRTSWIRRSAGMACRMDSSTASSRACSLTQAPIRSCWTPATARVWGPGMVEPSIAIAEGIVLGDVDTVILSHWHADHVGGAADADERPAFPNARHVMARVDGTGPGQTRPGH